MKQLKSVDKLIDAFHKLPGVGLRSAQKMAYSVLKMKNEDIDAFSNALLDVKNSIHQCPKCGNYTEETLCEFCSDSSRDNKTIIVVSSPLDIIPFEKIGTYKGVYHVLNGALSALNGISIDDLNVESLSKRIKDDEVNEIILATNPTLDGETTALYLARILENKFSNLKISRLAYGLPMGGNLEFADSLTLSRAFEGRKKI